MDERIFHLYRRVKELSDFLGGIHIGFFDPRRKIHFDGTRKRRSRRRRAYLDEVTI